MAFRARITGDKGIFGRLRGFGRVDFEDVVAEIAEAIDDDNRRGLRASTDAQDQPLDPVVTPAWKRGGNGPPTIPREDESRAIKNFRVEPRKSGGSWVFDCYWIACDHMRYWRERFPIFGVRKLGRVRIIKIIDRFLETRFKKL